MACRYRMPIFDGRPFRTLARCGNRSFSAILQTTAHPACPVPAPARAVASVSASTAGSSRTAPARRALAGLLATGLLVCSLLGGCASGSSAAAGGAGSADGSGDAGGSAGPVNVAVVTGACANQPVHSYAAVQDELERAVRSNGFADVIVADTSVSSELGGIAQVGSTTTNPTRRAQEEDAIVASLEAACEAAAADSPQTDVVRALRYAASGLAGLEGERVVCLLHSGLSTAGVVDLAETPDWLRADPGELAASLAEQLPDLSAIDVVYWYDLGYVAGDQREPDQVAVTGLERMWEAILTQAGVGAVEFVDSQVADEENPSEYEVDPVELEFAARPEVETSTLLESGGQVEIPESEVGFVPDTAAFLDEKAAQAYVSQVARVLLAHPEVSVYVTGSCAGCPWEPDDRGVALSTQRAQAVADLLVSMGVDASRIVVEGVGDQSNERVQHVPDLAADGVTQTEDAQLNRRVVITRNDG